jgi:hypothetical protein
MDKARQPRGRNNATGSQSEGSSPARTGLDRAKEEGRGSVSILRVAKQKLASTTGQCSFQPSTVEGHTSRNMASAAGSRGARQPRGGSPIPHWHTHNGPMLDGGPGQPWRLLHGTWAHWADTGRMGCASGVLHKNGNSGTELLLTLTTSCLMNLPSIFDSTPK